MGFLVDRDGWRKSFDIVNIRLIQAAQKLARIRGQRFYIAPLAFRKNGIKSQAGFSGTGKSREHHHFIAWDLKIDVFKIMFASSFDDYFIVFHSFLI